MSVQICLVPKLDGLGGMVSFQSKFIQGLEKRDIPYTFDLSHIDNTAVLVIGGTRQIWRLWRAKKHGVKIVQRLNGMNWLHKVRRTTLQASLRAEINNLILAFIRRYLADSIIYQSEFSQTWWEKVYKIINHPTHVVYNGIDLHAYTPDGLESPPKDHFRILLVEGHLGLSDMQSLENAIKLAQTLTSDHQLKVELMVVGAVSDQVKANAYSLAPSLWVTWRGVVNRSEIPAINRAAHVLFSADINAACPNSVIEALACGLPVLAFDTGALAEIVKQGAGEVVPYGADHWQLEAPAIPPLAEACINILEKNPTYRIKARCWAEETFGLEPMVDAYLEVLGGSHA
jgi:glycosyltransferase involved in cell wall biosynthesis